MVLNCMMIESVEKSGSGCFWRLSVLLSKAGFLLEVKMLKLPFSGLIYSSSDGTCGEFKKTNFPWRIP